MGPPRKKSRAYAYRWLQAATGLVAIAYVFCSPSLADDPLPVAPLPVALVNVDRLLKEFKPLNHQLDPLKAEAKDLGGAVQVRQAELEVVANHARQAQPGSPDFQRLQIQAVKLQTELQQFIAKNRQELQQKEAALYVAFLRQLDAEINKYAKAHGVKLVLSRYEASFDESQAVQNLAKLLNRTVLYEEQLDITDRILTALQAADKPSR